MDGRMGGCRRPPFERFLLPHRRSLLLASCSSASLLRLTFTNFGLLCTATLLPSATARTRSIHPPIHPSVHPTMIRPSFTTPAAAVAVALVAVGASVAPGGCRVEAFQAHKNPHSSPHLSQQPTVPFFATIQRHTNPKQQQPKQPKQQLFSSPAPKREDFFDNDDDDDDDEIPFALRETTTTTTTLYDTPNSGSDPSASPLEQVKAAFQKLDLPRIDVDVDLSFLEKLNLNVDLEDMRVAFDAGRTNLLAGTVGERGELYFAAQLFVVACVVAGGVPLVGGIATFLAGPGLVLAGLVVLSTSFQELGNALSPWPVPPTASNGDLKTAGVYGQMRHPMYAGLLALCAGLSISTGSANRLILTAALWYVLELKSDKEEEGLVEVFPEYEAYKKQTPQKFVPQKFVDSLPWMKK